VADHLSGRLMAYRVRSALVCAPDPAGKIRYHYQGAVIPWLSDDRAAHLLRLGMVEQTGTDFTPETDAGYGVKPKRTATQAVWAEYAVSQGADPDEAKGLTRDELVELYSEK